MSIKASYLLVGSSVSSSPSPAMMNEAFRAMKIPAVYGAESIETDGLGRFIGRCRRDETAGLNVTIPFKTAVVPLLNAIDQAAGKVGAVNTVKRENNGYTGFNTDIDGILRPLVALGSRVRLARGAVIGAGGAARAFVAAMNRLGCRELSIIARDPSRGDRIAKHLREAFPKMSLRVHGIEQNELQGILDLDILFNAAPIGGNGARVPEEIFTLLKGRPIVFDAVYDPVETELVRAARKRSCPIVLGYEMLLSQGVAAFEIWTGKRAPEEIMRRSLLAALQRGVV